MVYFAAIGPVETLPLKGLRYGTDHYILWDAMDSDPIDVSLDVPRARDPYLVKSVLHSSQLLRAFRTSGEALPLREVAKRSGLPKSMVFRLL